MSRATTAAVDDLNARLRRLTLDASRIAGGHRTGNARSQFGGQGVEFREARPYVAADDARRIDWRITARSNRPYVRVFDEDRDRSLAFVMDTSGSMGFGTVSAAAGLRTKWTATVECATLLAFIAVRDDAEVGWCYGNQLRKPSANRANVTRAYNDLMATAPEGTGTLPESLRRVATRLRIRSTVILMTDYFLSAERELLALLQQVRRRHELWVVVASDAAERALPRAGLVRFQDPETGQRRLIDTSSRRVREQFASRAAERRVQCERTLRRVATRLLPLNTTDDCVASLARFLRRATP